MSAHIVRRRPPVIPPQLAERRQTTELTEHQIYELIRYHTHDRVDHVNDDLEAELELIDALPAILAEATPAHLPNLVSPRLAHTLPRGTQSDAMPALAERTTIEVTETQRLAAYVTAVPRAGDLTRSATETPRTERPTVPAIPRPLVPALLASELESRPTEIGPSEPLPSAGMPSRSLLVGARRARRIVPIVLLLLALGAAAFWLLP